MKKFLTIAALALLAASCMQEKMSGEQGLPVRITIAMPDAATTRDLAEDESNITSLRLLIYKSSNGTLQYNEPLLSPFSEPKTIEFRTGTYDFVFIANEASLGSQAAGKISLGPETLKELRNISGSAMNSDLYTMVGHYAGVEVRGENELSYVDPFSESPAVVEVDGEWAVKMERLAIKVEVDLTLRQADRQKFTALWVEGHRTATWLLPSTENADFSSTGASAKCRDLTLPLVVSGLPEYLPKSGEKGMELVVDLAGRQFRARIGVAPDMRVLRNTSLEVYAAITEDLIINKVTVRDWGESETVAVNDRRIVLPAKGARYLAPPGVLGVDIVTGKLTLAGSKHFAQTAMFATYYDNSDLFGEPSPNTVYAALFKWGSGVALNWGGTIADAWSGEGNQWDWSDVMFYPEGWNPLSATAWEEIPYLQYQEQEEENKSLSDPCKLVADGERRWKTPDAGDPLWGLVWHRSMVVINDLLANGDAKSMPFYLADDEGFILPVMTGRRSVTGVFGLNEEFYEEVAEFWTSSTPPQGSDHAFKKTFLSPNPIDGGGHRSEAYMIRCVEE